MRRACICAVSILSIVIIVVPDDVLGRRIDRSFSDHRRHQQRPEKVVARETEGGPSGRHEERKFRRQETVEVAGSTLPDCSHACGSCKPCRLVMVSFICSSLEEAETCPMAYKCMCNSKSYPIP